MSAASVISTIPCTEDQQYHFREHARHGLTVFYASFLMIFHGAQQLFRTFKEKKIFAHMLHSGSLIRKYFRNLFLYFSLWYNRRRVEQKLRVLYLDISSNPYGRYLYAFLFFFSEAGYSIRLRHRAKLVAELCHYSRMALLFESLRLCFRKPQSVELYVTDKKTSDGSIVLSPDYYARSVRPHSMHVPMAMHPSMYKWGCYKERIQLLKTQNRHPRIFFAGNLDVCSYSNPVLGKKFGKLSRQEVIQHIVVSFSTEVAMPRNKIDLEQRLSAAARIVIVDTKAYTIPMDTLRSVLSHFEFFLAPPGAIMPLCHNIIEAMSVGCIPILQHGEFFVPPLEHGLNSLAFDDSENLSKSVTAGLAMKSEQIDKMRNAVLEYYENYLTPEAVVRRIIGKKRDEKLESLYLNAEEYSVQLFDDE